MCVACAWCVVRGVVGGACGVARSPFLCVVMCAEVCGVHTWSASCAWCVLCGAYGACDVWCMRARACVCLWIPIDSYRFLRNLWESMGIHRNL